MEERSNNANLLFRYFIGAMDSKDEQELREWFSQSESNRVLLDNIKDIDWVFRQLHDIEKEDQQLRIDRLRERIRSLESPGSSARSQVKQKAVKVVTRLAMLILISWIIYIIFVLAGKDPSDRRSSTNYVKQSGIEDPVTILAQEFGWIRSLGNMNVFQLGNRTLFDMDKRSNMFEREVMIQRIRLVMERDSGDAVMPDGSVIQLCPASSIDFATSFGTRDRQLALVGEGEFKVRSGSWLIDKPPPLFRVRILTLSGVLTMVAKGTNFHIKAYRDDSTVQVSLSEGRLEVQRDGIMLHDLKSGEVFTLHQDGNFDVFKPSNTGAAVTSASVNDGVFFDNKPISQIIQQIEKLYHKKIIVHGSSTDSLSLRLATQEKLEDVLRDIERAKPVHFDIYEDSVIMSHDQNP